jgi:uracil-DNA glycosylase
MLVAGYRRDCALLRTQYRRFGGTVQAMEALAPPVCAELPCVDVAHDRFVVPTARLERGRITILMVSEAAPARLEDWFYAGSDALFAQTTIQAFRDAGENVSSVADIVRRGVYLTTAVKCGKIGYGISTQTVKACSQLLEIELEMFPNARALLLMGDVAIKSLNAIARRAGEPRVVPAGATYRLRGGDYSFRGLKVFPSYVQAGPSFFIEKSKRRMIAEDIAAALAFVRSV